jgi:hypothetical protein
MDGSCNLDKISGTSHSHVHHGYLPIAKEVIREHGLLIKTILVESKKGRKALSYPNGVIVIMLAYKRRRVWIQKILGL